MRGGEVVLESIAELYPQATLYTLICNPDKISSTLSALPCQTSWLQKVPGIESRYRHFLPILPQAIGSLRIPDVDLVISSSHCVAKGIKKPKNAIHLSYVHAPMRYMWDRFLDYFGPGRASLPVRAAAHLVRGPLQSWDQAVSTPERIDQLMANSQFIANQIQRIYHRKATVIYPFANLERFQKPRNPGISYLMVGAFAPYKRIDLAIEAFNQMRLPLLIVGSGQDGARLKRLAGPTITFLGSLSNLAIADLYSQCRALIFPGIEDFGITPIEALAAGAPVIALEQGGAAETVTAQTGLFFKTQSVSAIIEAVQQFERDPKMISERECRERGNYFSKDRFKDEFKRMGEIFPEMISAILMPNHLHLILPQERDAVKILAGLLGAMTLRSDLRKPLWQPMPSPTIIPDTSHLRRQIRYLALNPCRKRLCRDPLEWYWSSYREVIGAAINSIQSEKKWAEILNEDHKNFGVRFHHYVSADPSVCITGTPFPKPARPQLYPERSICEILAAAAGALRMRPAEVRQIGQLRNLFIHLAYRHGWRRPIFLAEICSITPNAVHYILRKNSPEGIQSADLCLGDLRLRHQCTMDFIDSTEGQIKHKAWSRRFL
ncbi:unnamed protein product [Sphagnum jensenii]|uniref:Glycosyl transferase family 1 domain-containing protein n=1 Tax=Sphagnum jensenii TaxID=128206 RepID=A0ABP0VDF2_9BRYO